MLLLILWSIIYKENSKLSNVCSNLLITDVIFKQKKYPIFDLNQRLLIRWLTNSRKNKQTNKNKCKKGKIGKQIKMKNTRNCYPDKRAEPFGAERPPDILTISITEFFIRKTRLKMQFLIYNMYTKFHQR